MATQNNVTPMLPQDSEGIKPKGGNGSQSYYVDVPYILRDCKYAETQIVEEQEVTQTIGVHDTASLQAWLADVENAGFTLKKRKITVDEATGEIAIGWQDATATDFVVVDDQALSAPKDVAFKASDDEFLGAVKAKYQYDTDLEALLVALYASVTCLRIEHETGATFEKTWRFDQFENVNFVSNNIHLGKFDYVLNGETFKAEITTCMFYKGD